MPLVRPYEVLVVDPPWPYVAGGAKAARVRRFDRQWGYDVMNTASIFSLLHDRVFPMAAPTHTVFLWSIERALTEAEAAMASFGYKRHVRMVWNKKTGHAPAFTVQFSHEFLLWFYKPKLMPIDRAKRGKFGTVFESPPRQHGRKPDIAYERIAALYPNTRRLDVFSREDRPGYDSWGDEVGKFNGVGSRLFAVGDQR